MKEQSTPIPTKPPADNVCRPLGLHTLEDGLRQRQDYTLSLPLVCDSRGGGVDGGERHSNAGVSCQWLIRHEPEVDGRQKYAGVPIESSPEQFGEQRVQGFKKLWVVGLKVQPPRMIGNGTERQQPDS